MSEVVYYNAKDMEQNGIKLLCDEHKTIYAFDFTEHDKVFEDKIASLEKRMAYMKGKNNYLRTRCMEDAIDAFDRGAYGALTIVGRRVDLEAENDKLKQKISDLEFLMQNQDEFLEMKNIHIAELKQRIAELEEKNKNLVDMINELQLKKAHIDCDLYDANKRISELESKENIIEVRVPASPIEIATHLINNTCTINELKMIAEHINVYCNGGK